MTAANPAAPAPAPPASLPVFDDAAWATLAEHTNANLCFQCGTCTATCPVGELGDLNIRRLIRNAHYGRADPALWDCTTCGECDTSCPRGVRITDLIRYLRAGAWVRREVPAGLPGLMWAQYDDGNPFRLPPSNRGDWAKDLDLAGSGTTLLYVGCAGAFDPRAQQTVKAVATLLGRAEEDFAILGDHEVCCGETARSLGQDGLFQQLQEANTAAFAKAGIERVITISPHCYDALKTGQSGDLEVLHYTEALAGLMDADRLRVDLKGTTVTYHDPCYLARLQGVTEAPRRLLEQAGAEMVEMDRNRQLTRCCGGGGGRMWQETPADQRIGDLRVEEAAATETGLLCTSCPYCISCFEDAAKTKAPNLVVKDLAELLVGGRA